MQAKQRKAVVVEAAVLCRLQPPESMRYLMHKLDDLSTGFLLFCEKHVQLEDAVGRHSAVCSGDHVQ